MIYPRRTCGRSLSLGDKAIFLSFLDPRREVVTLLHFSQPLVNFLTDLIDRFFFQRRYLWIFFDLFERLSLLGVYYWLHQFCDKHGFQMYGIFLFIRINLQRWKAYRNRALFHDYFRFMPFTNSFSYLVCKYFLDLDGSLDAPKLSLLSYIIS
jgi:hypothetical protein